MDLIPVRRHPGRFVRVVVLGALSAGLWSLSSARAADSSRAIEDHVLPRSGVRFETLNLPAIPVFVPRVEHGGKIETLRRRDIAAELRIVTGLPLNERGKDPLPPPLPRVSCRFEEYSAVDHAWFVDLMAWFRREIHHLAVTYRAQTWDCDNFSLALNAFADLAQVDAPRRDPPRLIGRLIVTQKFAWGGTPAGGAHEVVIFRSDLAWWVSEPQSGAMVPLNEYPNRRHIQEALFN
jgi:hypothetical protein